MRAARRADVLAISLLMLLPLLWFAPHVIGGRTLLPADNLFGFEPWRSYAAEFGVGTPHNALISDLILENHTWKTLIREALAAGDPGAILWNPRNFAGSPFLAAGQQSALYPLSLVFYVLPLWLAYGVFTWLQLGLAAVSMYVLARVLGLRPLAAVFSAITYAFSGFFIVSVNFTMIIAAAAWLPLLLACIEVIFRKQEQKGRARYSPVPYVAAGALVLGIQVLAGHVEITYYALLVSAFYALFRLAIVWRRLRSRSVILRLTGWLTLMMVLGLALGGVQLLPLYELVRENFREGSASLQQIREWAWPSRQIITFLLPDAFGNPTHHSYFDIWAGAWRAVTVNALGEPLDTIDWGVKNYVEGANYLGLPALALALLAVGSAVTRWLRRRNEISGGADGHPQWPIACFGLLAVISLLLAFGTPLYALLYYALPGFSQLHSAFRWVLPYTLSMAVLAGIGLEMLTGAVRLSWRRTAASAAGAVGIGSLGVVALSRLAPGPFVALGERLLAASDLARARGFADGAMAWSYEATGLARFGILALGLAVALALTGARSRLWAA